MLDKTLPAQGSESERQLFPAFTKAAGIVAAHIYWQTLTPQLFKERQVVPAGVIAALQVKVAHPAVTSVMLAALPAALVGRNIGYLLKKIAAAHKQEFKSEGLIAEAAPFSR